MTSCKRVRVEEKTERKSLEQLPVSDISIAELRRELESRGIEHADLNIEAQLVAKLSEVLADEANKARDARIKAGGALQVSSELNPSSSSSQSKVPRSAIIWLSQDLTVYLNRFLQFTD